MIKNQKRIILIGAVLLLLLIPLYFFVIAPLLTEEEPVVDPPELLKGEVYDSSTNRILLFEHVQRAAIKSIEVHNEKGSYTFYLDKDGKFYIKDMEGAPYNLELFSALVVAAGNTMSLERVTIDCPDLSVYGLDAEDDPAWYVLTKTDGTEHKVYIGDATPSGGAYYVRYEGRNAVYTLDATIQYTLLAGINALITPILSFPISEDEYFKTDDFFIVRDGEIITHIDYVPEDEEGTEHGTGTWKMILPGNYIVNATNMGTLIQYFAEFVGSETVEYGAGLSDRFFSDEEDKIDEDVAKYMEYLRTEYGIESDFEKCHYMLHYTINDVESYVIFSKPDLEGNMYAYSTLYDLVAKINISACPFMQWSSTKFVEKGIFSQMITEVKEIKVESKDVNITFFIAGEEGDTRLQVTTNYDSRPYGAAMYASFQEWYRELAGLYIQDTTLSKDTSNLFATITVTADDGTVTVYRFYPYSTRNCYFTIDGKGEFYLLNEKVERLIADAGRLMRGETVDADAIY